MRTRSLSDLRTDAYRLADVEGATERFPTAEVSRYVNQGAAWVWEQLVQARGYAYYGKLWLTLGSVSSSGTTPPTVTGSGQPSGLIEQSGGTWSLIVDIVAGGTLGNATFRTSADGGATYGDTVATAATDYLYDHNVALTFASGTYNTDNVYTIPATLPATTAGVSEYALPSDFYKLHSVVLQIDDSRSQQLEPFGNLDEAALRDLVISPAGTPAYYDIRGTGTVQRIELLPKPSSAYSLRVKYVPSAYTLTDDADRFDGLNGFEDAVATYAAIRMATKNREDELVMLLGQMMTDWERRIKDSATTRDQGRPPRVQDTRLARRLAKWGWLR